MKKTVSLLLAAILLLTMAACTPASDERSDTQIPTGLVLEDVYQSILNAQTNPEELVMFPESDPGLIESFYPGLGEMEMAQQIMYFPPILGFVSEVVLVEVVNPDDAQAVADIFRARIEKGAADVTYPEVAAYWKTCAQVQTAGNYVAMIALPENYTIPENVFSIQN